MRQPSDDEMLQTMNRAQEAAYTRGMRDGILAGVVLTLVAFLLWQGWLA